jgi:hypothetical protein
MNFELVFIPFADIGFMEVSSTHPRYSIHNQGKNDTKAYEQQINHGEQQNQTS